MYFIKFKSNNNNLTNINIITIIALRIALLKLKSEKEDLLSKFKSVCQLYKQLLQDAVTSEAHKMCDGLHFLEIREMSRIFENLANLYIIYNVLSVSSSLHLLNEVLAD